MTVPGKGIQNGAISRLPALLRKVASRPSAEVVHKVRTTIRRAETAMHVVDSSDLPRLSKQLKRIRKRVGALRDIDVQSALLEGLNRIHDKDAVAVKTALNDLRRKQERKAKKVVNEELEDGLLKRLRKVSAGSKGAAVGRGIDLRAIADEFMSELGKRILNDSNLHEFRTVAKKLKYRAELAAESELRGELISALKDVQDAIGAWHDGVTLSETANKVLGDSKRNSLVALLATQNRSRALEALRAVERGRSRIAAMFEPAAKKPTRSEVLAKTREAASA